MKITALYERLSRDDALKDESLSIKHQKEMLETYAARHGFGNIRHFVDDGVSGTVFSRPGLDALLAEVRAGNVATVIIKDASRLGRDVYEIGNLKKAFDDNDVRLIAADGNLDTANGFDIMSIFRDVFNEWFVADTSKKIRAVMRTKAVNGKHSTTQAPYGYKPSEADKFVWEIDEPAAEVVREIFRLFIGGMGTVAIAHELRKKGIKIPSAHKAERDNKPIRYNLKYPDTYWRGGVVTPILDNLEYTGVAVMQKMVRKSYKDSTVILRPENEWIIHENSHEAIVDAAIFEAAKKLRHGRKKPTRRGDLGVLNGLLVCSECGKRLHMRRQSNKDKNGVKREYCTYDCSMAPVFKSKYAKCACHSVKREAIEELVLMYLRKDIEYAKTHEKDFLDKITAKQDKEQENTLRKSQSEFSKAQKRITELDDIITRTFEHGITDKLSKERFEFLLNKYETEQLELKKKVAELEKILSENVRQIANAEKFIALIREVTTPTELTRELAYKLIERVVVGKAEFIGAGHHSKKQDITIRYNFIGEIEDMVLESSRYAK